MALIRLFFALPLDPAATAALGTLERSLPERGRRRIPAEDWHVTLAFLGDTDAGRVPALTALGQRAAAGFAACALLLDSLQWWPSLARPRLLAAVAEKSAPLLPLHAVLRAGLSAAGIAFDDRPLRPHITLQRLQRGVVPDDLALPACRVAVAVRQLALYVSEPAPGGRRYRPLQQWSLAVPPGAGD